MNPESLRRIGTWLIAAGAFLIVCGVYGLNTTVVNCPANGCSSSELWAIYGPYEVSLWSGAILLVSGIAMVVLPYFMPKPTETVPRDATRSEATRLFARAPDARA